MKNILLLILAIFHLSSIQSQTIGFEHVNAKTFETLITEQPGTLLDVRTSSEFKNRHLGNAGQLNFYALDFK